MRTPRTLSTSVGRYEEHFHPGTPSCPSANTSTNGGGGSRHVASLPKLISNHDPASLGDDDIFVDTMQEISDGHLPKTRGMDKTRTRKQEPEEEATSTQPTTWQQATNPTMNRHGNTFTTSDSFHGTKVNEPGILAYGPSTFLQQNPLFSRPTTACFSSQPLVSTMLRTYGGRRTEDLHTSRENTWTSTNCRSAVALRTQLLTTFKNMEPLSTNCRLSRVTPDSKTASKFDFVIVPSYLPRCPLRLSSSRTPYSSRHSTSSPSIQIRSPVTIALRDSYQRR